MNAGPNWLFRRVEFLTRILSVICLMCVYAMPARTMAYESVVSSRSELAAKELTLFAFDDHGIPWKDNLQLTLVQAEKHSGNPVLRRGPKGAPDYGHAILYGSVLKIGDVFRMWYLGMGQRELKRGQAPGYWRPMCYAESRDGIHWTKPDLGLVEYNGSRRNNICEIIGPDADLTRVDDFLSVLHDPADPNPQRRFKAAFIAHVPWTHVKGGIRDVGSREGRLCAMVCATSADGLRWKIAGDRPAVNEKFEVSGFYRFGNFFYATGQQITPWVWLPGGRPTGRAMTVFRSANLARWSSAKALAFARVGQRADSPIPGQQTHMGAGLWNRGNVLVGLYGMWQDGPPRNRRPKGASHLYGTRIDLGLVVSNDGIHFREPVPGFKVIPRGRDGQWDSIALLQGHAFVNQGERTYIWYSHWDCEGKFRSQEIGLATLRRDGFGYLSQRSTNSSGYFVTRTIQPGRAGTRLFLNVAGARLRSPLTVELLDARDRPIPGYSGPDAARITADGTRREIRWPHRKSGLANVTATFSVKVTYPSSGDVRVYALYAERVDEWPNPPVRRLKTPGGVEFGLWGFDPVHPAPTLFILAGKINDTLGNAYYRQCGNDLARRGYLCVSIDLPCHGGQRRKGEPQGISGWSYRAGRNDNFVAESNARLSEVLDYLIKSGLTDLERIAACGTSRGGFLALHFAAHDRRVRCVAAFAPVTDLTALREFRGLEKNALVSSLSLNKHAKRLAGRDVWIVIGDQDRRVGTDHAVELARRLMTVSKQEHLSSRVELHVLPEPRGHSTPRGSPEQAAGWIFNRLGKPRSSPGRPRPQN